MQKKHRRSPVYSDGKAANKAGRIGIVLKSMSPIPANGPPRRSE